MGFQVFFDAIQVSDRSKGHSAFADTLGDPCIVGQSHNTESPHDSAFLKWALHETHNLGRLPCFVNTIMIRVGDFSSLLMRQASYMVIPYHIR
jgi:hypothetical protein